LEEFLARNKLAGEPAAGIAPWVASINDDFGWPRDPMKKYTLMGPDFATTSPYTVEIAADYDASPPDLFVEISH
jgi:hypothetical protein